MRDPLYRKISKGLEGRLDPEVFERVVCELLRKVFPGLVSVSGGGDFGFDGAIADGEGEPFPLVVTTAQDGLRNLGKNLDRYLQSGGARRQAVFATSQSLSGTKRQNLHTAARERGFELVQIFDRDAIAIHLYRYPAHRKELLGIPGDLPALTSVPPTKRPFLDLGLIGRKGDLDWLQATGGDRVVVGEPGSGKTYLLHHHGQEAGGLFLNSKNLGPVADALREMEPAFVIADDAHLDPDALVRLRHLREVTGATFEIVAATWKSGRDEVVEALGCSPDHVHTLELLTRGEVLQIYERAGVETSDAMMRELVAQASNKPGLAGTLAVLWLQGSWQEVLRGEAVTRNLLNNCGRFVDSAEQILASFSLGGGAGLPMGTVASFLGEGLAKIRNDTAVLANSGMLFEVGSDALSVRPNAMRSVLLRKVFFPRAEDGRSLRLPYAVLLRQVPDRRAALHAILEAVARAGAQMPPDELRALLRQDGDAEAWRWYVSLGRVEALWALESYPGPFSDLARQALETAPEETLRRALQLAGEDDGVFDALASWLQDPAQPSLEQLLERRRLLARTVRGYRKEGGDSTTSLRALFLALSPRIDGTSIVGLGDTIRITRGYLEEDGLRELIKLWESFKDLVTELPRTMLDEITDLVWALDEPSSATLGQSVEKVSEALARDLAERVLRHLATLPQSVGVAVWLRDLGQQMRIDLDLPIDPIFDLLYPNRDGEELISWEERWEEARRAIQPLGREWSAKDPTEVARRIRELEKAREISGRGVNERMVVFLEELSAASSKPEGLWGAFLGQGLAPFHLRPMVTAVVERKRPEWEEMLARLLDEEPYDWIAFEIILSLSEPPPDLLLKALKEASRYPQLVRTLCLQNRVSLPVLTQLLDHGDWRVARQAAIGEWLADPKRVIKPEVETSFRDAVVRSRTTHGSTPPEGPDHHGDFYLSQLLASDKELAFGWLVRRFHTRDLPAFVSPRSPFWAAMGALDDAARKELLDHIPAHRIARYLLPLLIARKVPLFQSLLAKRELRPYALKALEGLPDEAWADLVELALEEGFSPEEVAENTFPTIYSYSGHGVETWQDWVRAFEGLEDHLSRDVRAVAALGRAKAEARLEPARAEERRYELQGH